MHLSIEFIALLTSFDPGDYLLCVHVKFAPERNYRTTAGLRSYTIYGHGKLNSQFIVTTFFYLACGWAVIIQISNEHNWGEPERAPH